MQKQPIFRSNGEYTTTTLQNCGAIGDSIKEKYRAIILNYSNGNRVDVSRAIQKLTKKELIELVIEWGKWDNYGDEYTMPITTVETIQVLLKLPIDI